MGIRNIYPSFRVWVLFFLILNHISVNSQTSLLEKFKQPDEEARPWTFWYWMHGAVSKEGIKADLQAMKDVGMGGAYVFFIRGTEKANFPNAVNQLTPEWWKMLNYSFQVADSLNMKLGMHISDGFALAGGPWIKPAESMQKIVFTYTIISGGKNKLLKLRQPETVENYYNDIAIYALPVQKVTFKELRVKITSNNPEDSIPFLLPDKEFKSAKPCYIQYEYERPFTLRHVEITSSNYNIQSQRFFVLASNDGVRFDTIRQLTPPRQGWQNFSFNNTFALPTVKARFFRFVWTPAGTEPGAEDFDAAKWRPTLKVKAIKLSSDSKINAWEAKSGLVWRIAPATTSHDIPGEQFISSKRLLNLTSQFKNGTLSCRLPKGNWHILRIGHTSTGMTNATGGGGKGLECDKFSEFAVQKQFDNWFGAMFANTDSVLAHKVLKFMHIDSWECGSQNWSSNFAQEFKDRRGYDLMPYLPVMAGFPVDNIATSEKVLHDVRVTISELVNDVFFKVMVKNGKAVGCEISAECVAPTMLSDGLLHYKEVDRPMGEFWLRSPTHDKPNDMLDAVSGAHIYGKNIVQAEGFTQLRTVWDETPALLKPLLDRNFALGLNKFFFHVFTHNPYVDKAPGMSLDGMGLFFQRDQTWWKQGKSFVDYIARCQAMLQYGKPVVDLAVFTGEEIPSRAILPHKLIDFIPEIIGTERVQKEKSRLANVGQPMHEKPDGVSCSANILDPADWVNPLNGYAYDSFNKDVLMQATAENGKMKLPGGAEYEMILLPVKSQLLSDSLPYSSEVIKKIAELKKAGVHVIQPKPYPASFSVQPDAIVPENIAWTHRRGTEGDVYFISNQENKQRTIHVALRCWQNKPELWNPVTGNVEIVEEFKQTYSGTEFKLTLAPYESTFVVFYAGNSKTTQKYQSEEPKFTELNGIWQINFPKNQQSVTTKNLFDWSKHPNPLIQYYSGTATYKTSFDYPLSAVHLENSLFPVYLELGKVFDVATVRINGIECGTTWTAPYEVEISKALRQGANILEIQVTNTWANALNGADKGTPPFSGIWTDAKYRMKDKKLLESGLLGHVRIRE